jgi:hypothetical protein
VLHRYFRIIAGEGLDRWNKERLLGEKDTIGIMLVALGVNNPDARKMAASGVEILSRAVTDERGRWVLAAHREGFSEMPLTGVVEGELVRAVIDRTFVDKEGTRWVIDFKTGSHGGGSLEEFLESEKARYKPKLESYAALMEAGGEKRRIKKALYYPALSEWIEW